LSGGEQQGEFATLLFVALLASFVLLFVDQ